MVQGQVESIRLLQRIVEVQRKMLAGEVNPDCPKVPQVWTLYKEVQGYYENGLRVPDDVTLLWAEDNWGNVRRLPTAEERMRPGGAGVYYHFDYHGGPRSYQWINTNPIAKIWEQMSLAKQYGADRIWIVNVGHFKGYEFPTEYFLEPGVGFNSAGPTRTSTSTRGCGRSASSAPRMPRMPRRSSRSTASTTAAGNPSLLDATTYSLVNYNEYETVVADYNALVARAQAVYDKLPAAKKDAFYELALFPAKASAQVNEMYLAAAKNALYAQQGRASTNDMADRTRELFKADGDLMTYFNKSFAGGKWDHFMDQSHIGYTSWADPPQNTMNAIRLTRSKCRPRRSWVWPWRDPLSLARRGRSARRCRSSMRSTSSASSSTSSIGALRLFDFSATTSAPWIVLSESRVEWRRTSACGSPSTGAACRGNRSRGSEDCRAGGEVIV